MNKTGTFPSTREVKTSPRRPVGGWIEDTESNEYQIKLISPEPRKGKIIGVLVGFQSPRSKPGESALSNLTTTTSEAVTSFAQDAVKSAGDTVTNALNAGVDVFKYILTGKGAENYQQASQTPSEHEEKNTEGAEKQAKELQRVRNFIAASKTESSARVSNILITSKGETISAEQVAKTNNLSADISSEILTDSSRKLRSGLETTINKQEEEAKDNLDANASQSKGAKGPDLRPDSANEGAGHLSIMKSSG